MMMTGSSRCLALILLSKSMPEPPGMRMSETSTCGSSSSSAARTSRGLVKLRTTNSSRVSAFSSTKRIDWSSSTIQMGFMRSDALRTSAREAVEEATSGEGNHDLEDRAAGFAFEFDSAMVLLNEGLRQCEPESRAAFAARHERKEDPLAQRLRNSRAVVLDMQFQCQTIAMLAQGDLPRHPRAQGDLGIADGYPL